MRRPRPDRTKCDLTFPCSRYGCKVLPGDAGCFWKTQSKDIVQFIVWDFGGEEPPQPKGMTWNELLAIVAEKRKQDRQN